MSSYQRYPRNIDKLMPKVNQQAIELYGFIAAYFAQHEYMPTVREMCKFAGGRSTSIISYHLKVLVEWEWIERQAKAGRGMRLTRSTERGLKPAQLRALLAINPLQTSAARRSKRSRMKKAMAQQQIKPFQG